jgi:hypothetical protein
LAGPCELALRGAGCDFEERGDLVVGHAVQVVEQEHGPVAWGESREGALEIEFLGMAAGR